MQLIHICHCERSVAISSRSYWW